MNNTYKVRVKVYNDQLLWDGELPMIPAVGETLKVMPVEGSRNKHTRYVVEKRNWFFFTDATVPLVEIIVGEG